MSREDKSLSVEMDGYSTPVVVYPGDRLKLVRANGDEATVTLGDIWERNGLRKDGGVLIDADGGTWTTVRGQWPHWRITAIVERGRRPLPQVEGTIIRWSQFAPSITWVALLGRRGQWFISGRPGSYTETELLNVIGDWEKVA